MPRLPAAPGKLLPLSLLICMVCPALARTWTDTQGRTVQAEAVGADETTVTIKLPGGRTTKVNLETLSKPDREFVARWQAKNKTAAPSPSPALPMPPPLPKPMTGTVGMGSGGPVGFNGTWPVEIAVVGELEIRTIKEDDAAKVYIYQSPHFEFKCDVPLKGRLVAACARVFEATHELLRLLPLNNRGTAPQGKLYPVILFEAFGDYVEAGGRKGSAGVCMEDRRTGATCVLVPLQSLGVKKVGKEYTVDATAKDYHVLSHEITHAVMDSSVKQASWYIEGSAEYSANTPYNFGRYRVSANRTSVVESVTAYGKDGEGGRALGRNITMPPLSRFMTMSYRDFQMDGGFNYGVACLLTYYFYHIDGKGDAARIKAYLKELQNGVSEEEARAKLLDGRTWTQLEEEFMGGMKKLRVEIAYRR